MKNRKSVQALLIITTSLLCAAILTGLVGLGLNLTESKQMVISYQHSMLGIFMLFFVIALIIISVVARFWYIHNQFNNLELSLNNFSDGIVLLDVSKNMILFNHSFTTDTGLNESAYIGQSLKDILSSKNKENLCTAIQESLDTTDEWEGTVYVKATTDTDLKKNLSIKAITIGKKKNYLCLFKALSIDNTHEEYINKLKNYNTITNLPNRTILMDKVNAAISDSSESFALVGITIINFKKLFVNKKKDVYGRVLRLFVEEFLKYSREYITVSEITVEDFVVMLPSKSVKGLVDGLESIMQKEIVVDGTRYLFKLKIGVVEYPSDGEQSFELFENLTIAIEKAKDSEDIVYYNNSMKEPILRQLIIESELEKALELDEFTIFYQPQINSQTNRVTGIEALLRWNNKALGPVSPGEFIQVAENSGMIIEIGYWIIENICKQLKEWEKTITVDFKVAINISPMQFNNVNFFELLKDTLTKYGVDHSLIEVEITEGIFLEKYDQINEKLRSIQINGITIAVDDFGTGFSSLSYLKNLNIDKLKIDRAFIKDFPEKDDGTIAYIIAHLAQKLDLEVIAEGVETLAQIDYLKSINCFEIQGFYYSKPLPAKGIYDLIVERNGKKKH